MRPDGRDWVDGRNIAWIARVPHLGEAVQRIVEGLHPVQIFLFGSHARQEATKRSDVDLLVVLSDITEWADKGEAIEAVLELLRPVPIFEDVLVSTPEDLERGRQIGGSVIHNILRDGKPLYERSRSNRKGLDLPVRSTARPR